MEDLLRIGLISKPQGVRGELKIQPLTDDINRFAKLKEVIIDGSSYRVTSVKIGGGVVFMSLFGLTDRDQAERFRNKFICVNRENAIPLEEGRYFIVDVIGCVITTDQGQTVGEVFDVISARTDIFTVKGIDGKIMRFPFLKDAIIKVDVENKSIVLKDKRLKEIACYED